MLRKLVGHNILGFDLPYLDQSDMIHKANGHAFLNSRHYWDGMFFDTMKRWHSRDMISLDKLAKALGHPTGKNGNGKHFYALPDDQKEEYLTNDLKLVEYVFTQMNKGNRVCDESIIFDIETAPLREDIIESLIPEFDPDSVKVGNLKDPTKIEEKIEQARENHLQSYVNKAGLDARFSIPCAIGYIINGEVELHFDEPRELINRFWEVCGQVWGHNIKVKIK